MTQPEYPFRVPFNSSFSVSLECLEDAEDAFELLHSDGKCEVFGIFDKHDRPIKLIKKKPNEPVTIEFDESPPSASKWTTSRTFKL